MWCHKQSGNQVTLEDVLADEDRWEIEPAELRQLLDQREDAPFVLVDCREEEEHAAESIGGDILMPLSNFPSEVVARLEGEPSPIMVYCHLGMRSLQAVQYLRSKGHRQAYSLRGGMEAWQRVGS